MSFVMSHLVTKNIIPVYHFFIDQWRTMYQSMKERNRFVVDYQSPLLCAGFSLYCALSVLMNIFPLH